MRTRHEHADTEPHTDAFASASDLRAYMQQVRAARAEKQWAELDREAEAKKQYIARLKVPTEITDDKVASAVSRMRALAADGKSEMMVLRFPSELCSDRGRMINQGEPGWEETLIGVPRQVYECWRDRLKPLGYRMTASVLEFPGGLPGDVGLFLDWGQPK